MKNIKQIMKERDSIIADKNFVETMFNLKFRWNDEQGYEDFNDYKKVVSDMVKDMGFELISLSKTFISTLKGTYGTYSLKLYNSGSCTVEVKSVIM